MRGPEREDIEAEMLFRAARILRDRALELEAFGGAKHRDLRRLRATAELLSEQRARHWGQSS